MPTYTVTDPQSGKTVDLTGDSPPTEEELNQIFSSLGGSASSEAPGALESGALGLMSGIPGAETAVSGLESLGKKTYGEAHQGLEDAKDAAWNAHPFAYGTGKGAGLVATGVAAPEGIPGMIGVGALSGVDAANKPSDIPMDAATGAATGYGLGQLGEKVIAPALKAAPEAAKNLLSGFGKGTTREGIDALLQSKGIIDASMNNNQRAEALMSTINELARKTGAMSADARSELSPDVRTLTAPLEMASKGILESTPGGIVEQEGLTDKISPLFDKLKALIAPEGVGTTEQKEAALQVLEKQKQRLINVAAKNGGVISEKRLGEIIRDIQDEVKPATWEAHPETKEPQLALKKISGIINNKLKGVVERDADGNIVGDADFGNLPYAEKMKLVAENSDLLDSLDETFSPTIEKGVRVPSETTNRVMGNLLKEPRTVARDLLQQLYEKGGDFDFLTDAKASAIRDSFGIGDSEAALKNRGSGSGLRRFGALLGTGVGYALGHPWVGAYVGADLPRMVDGGPLAYNIVSAYIKGANSGISQTAQAALKQYGPILANAAKQGGTQLAATHFVLATSHPAYQALAKELSERQDNSQ